MSITTHDGTNHNGLFDILGKAFHAIDILNTSRGTTLPGVVVAFLDQLGLRTVTTKNANDAQNVPQGLASWQSSGATLTSAVGQSCQSIVASFVQADTTSIPNAGLADNLAYLIAQMKAAATTGGDHVTSPTTSITVTAGGSNVSDTIIAATIRGGNGLNRDNVLPEAITAAASFSNLALTSLPAVQDGNDSAWPGGSGLNTTLRIVDSAASLLTNGDFSLTTVVNIPDGWILTTATPGTTLTVSLPCQQSVAIGGTPTGGAYYLSWQGLDGKTRSTAALNFDAAASAVQAALRAITGLEAVSVLDTGTSPNLTHTITFTGVGGAVSALTYTSQLTGGSPTITISGTVVAADSASYRGTSMIWTSNGSQTTTIYQQLPALTAETVYCLHFRARQAGTTLAAGQLKIEIMDGIGGSVTVDDATNSNALTLAYSDLTTSYKSFPLFFAVTPGQSQPLYLRVRISTALTSGSKVYFDEFALTAAQELYAGGPLAAAFAGATALNPLDTWTITAANDLGGKFQEWFNRVFGMAAMGLVLPTAGSTLIADSLIA